MPSTVHRVEISETHSRRFLQGRPEGFCFNSPQRSQRNSTPLGLLCLLPYFMLPGFPTYPLPGITFLCSSLHLQALLSGGTYLKTMGPHCFTGCRTVTRTVRLLESVLPHLVILFFPTRIYSLQAEVLIGMMSSFSVSSNLSRTILRNRERDC